MGAKLTPRSVPWTSGLPHPYVGRGGEGDPLAEPSSSLPWARYTLQATEANNRMQPTARRKRGAQYYDKLPRLWPSYHIFSFSFIFSTYFFTDIFFLTYVSLTSECATKPTRHHLLIGTHDAMQAHLHSHFHRNNRRVVACIGPRICRPSALGRARDPDAAAGPAGGRVGPPGPRPSGSCPRRWACPRLLPPVAGPSPARLVYLSSPPPNENLPLTPWPVTNDILGLGGGAQRHLVGPFGPLPPRPRPRRCACLPACLPPPLSVAPP